jgi:hypothetical protein
MVHVQALIRKLQPCERKLACISIFLLLWRPPEEIEITRLVPPAHGTARHWIGCIAPEIPKPSDHTDTPSSIRRFKSQ